ncbi:USP, partial [Symbiodinium pilosum]
MDDETLPTLKLGAAQGPAELQKLAATEPLKLPEQQLAQQLLEQVYVKARTTVERLAGPKTTPSQGGARLAMEEWAETQQAVINFFFGGKSGPTTPAQGGA